LNGDLIGQLNLQLIDQRKIQVNGSNMIKHLDLQNIKQRKCSKKALETWLISKLYLIKKYYKYIYIRAIKFLDAWTVACPQAIKLR
jgi:hypothetical protein